MNNKLSKEYDSLNANSVQLNIKFKFAIYQAIAKRQVLKFNINSNAIYSKAKILANEINRIGGINNLRGFNDNIFASDGYIISTIEYRFLLDRNSFLNVFLDHAYMRIISQETKSPWQNYIGMGLGMQFLTNAGNFGLFIAVSKTENSSFDFSAPKVHFGYTALF